MKDILIEILWALERLDNRISGLEMDSEGRGDDSISTELDELEKKIESLDSALSAIAIEPGIR